MRRKDSLTEAAKDAAAGAQRELARAAKATRQLLMGSPEAEFEDAFTPEEEEEATEPPERVEERRTWREKLHLRRKAKP